MIYTLFVVAAVVAAVLLILIVLIQDNKGGATGALGGSGATQMMGAKRAGDFLEKATWGCAITFMALCIGATFMKKMEAGETTNTNANIKAAQETQQSITAPLPSAETTPVK